MKKLVKDFRRETLGQDLLEYTLLIAFVVLASVAAALFCSDAGGIKSMLSKMSSPACPPGTVCGQPSPSDAPAPAATEQKAK